MDIVSWKVYKSSFLLYFLIGASVPVEKRGGYWGIFVAPSSLCVDCIVGLKVYYTSECFFLRTLIDSP